MKKEKKNKGLTPKQERFCHEYIIDLNATRAAKAVGYGKSENSSASSGSQLLRNLKVQEKIRELNDKHKKKTGITAEFVLNGLKNMADFDLADCFDESGKLKNIHDIPKEARKVLASIETFEEYEGFGRDRTYIGDTKKVKIFDKTKAYEMLGRHIKLFTDKVEISGSIGRAERLSRALKEKK